MGRLHVIPNGAESWAVRQERDGGIVGEYASQGEAEEAARGHALAHGDGEIVVHDRFGRTRATDLDPVA